MTTQTFKQAYDVLQRHAQTLRNSTEPNIDDLLAIVNESSQAYKVCKARIDAVEKALAQAMSEQDLDIELTDVPAQPLDQNEGTQPPATPASDYSEIDEDDVPF
ncbi:exodeoxyribonuclease VII small subunit [Orrella sp. 11846]|uniref:exodeoxyribonuclease VII small subunit n=1 Tax=Orrella sp. 11846 TaxID=3409913 RepID=UPI003B5A658F